MSNPQDLTPNMYTVPTVEDKASENESTSLNEEVQNEGCTGTAEDAEMVLKEKLKMSMLKKKLQQATTSAPMSSSESSDVKTTHVRIDNFQRPLHVKSLLQWLCQTCQIELKEDNIWINSIKTHCYVNCASLEDAEKCISSVTGKKFPATNTSTLTASFTLVSAKDAPNSEEANLKPHEWKTFRKTRTVDDSQTALNTNQQPPSSSSGSSSNAINKNAALKRKLSEVMESVANAPANLFKRATVSAIQSKTASSASSATKASTSEVVTSVEESIPKLRRTETTPSISWCPVSDSVANTRIKLFRHRMGLKSDKETIKI